MSTTSNAQAIVATSRPGTYSVRVDSSGTSQLVPQELGGATDITGSTAFGTAYQNTGESATYQGYATTSVGGSVGTIKVLIGPTNPPTMGAWGDQASATVIGGNVPFSARVPAGWWWQINVTGAVNGLGSCLRTV